MKMYKKINREEFAEYLMTHLVHTNDGIEFALFANVADDVTEAEENNCEYWYFAKRLRLEEYESTFILLDYCGGEEAFAIPIHNYNAVGFDMDDRNIVPDYVKRFFKQLIECNNSVWVAVDNE